MVQQMTPRPWMLRVLGNNGIPEARHADINEFITKPTPQEREIILNELRPKFRKMIRQIGPKEWMVRVVVNQAKARSANQGIEVREDSMRGTQIPEEYQLPKPWGLSTSDPDNGRRMKQSEAKQKLSRSSSKGTVQAGPNHQLQSSDSEGATSDVDGSTDEKKVIRSPQCMLGVTSLFRNGKVLSFKILGNHVIMSLTYLSMISYINKKNWPVIMIGKLTLFYPLSTQSNFSILV